MKVGFCFAREHVSLWSLKLIWIVYQH